VLPLLTDLQTDLLGERLVPLYQSLERFVINSVARRLRKMHRYTETAELQAQSMQKLGFSPARIQREALRTLQADKAYRVAVAENTRAYKKEITACISQTRTSARASLKEVMTDAGNMAFRGDLRLWREAGNDLTKPSAFAQIVKAMRNRTGEDLLNLTQTTAFRTNTGLITPVERAFTYALDMALVKVTSGVQGFSEAIRDAVIELADSGLRTVDYQSGVHRQLDSAARNCIQTAVGQLSGDIMMENCRLTGVAHVQVSAHWGARTDGTGGHGDHRHWQGKVYCIEGSDGQYANLGDATGYPYDPRGLKGYGCRHDFYPYWIGVSEPVQWPAEPRPITYQGRRYTYTEATQKQRSMERDIRRYKRRAYASEALGVDTAVIERSIEARKDAYKHFSDIMKLRAKWERTMITGDGAVDWKRVFAKV
jgi:hypothetical protein